MHIQITLLLTCNNYEFLHDKLFTFQFFNQLSNVSSDAKIQTTLYFQVKNGHLTFIFNVTFYI